MLSPSSVFSFLTTIILTWASSRLYFLRSEILHRMNSSPFLMVTTAFLLKMMVSPLARGTVNLAKMMPAMHAWMMTPAMDCRHMTNTANGHCSVVALLHYMRKKT